MKKYLKVSLATIIFLPSFIFGQNGYFDNNPIWAVSSSCAPPSCSPPTCIEYSDYNYYLNGDTAINSHIYNKLFTKGTVWHSWFSSPPVPSCCQVTYTFHDTLNPVAFLRDTLNKIFIIDDLGNPEMLLYDFNLSVGDSLPLSYNNWDSAIIVIAIDSVPISNFYRKRFELSFNAVAHYLIEGIGHDHGLLETINGVLECGWSLHCYGLGDTAYYPIPGATCDNAVGIKEPESLTTEIILFPNPFDEKLTVVKKRNERSEIILYDIMSKILWQQEFISSVSLNTEQLAKGIYLYEVTNRDGVINKGKVVKY